MLIKKDATFVLLSKIGNTFCLLTRTFCLIARKFLPIKQIKVYVWVINLSSRYPSDSEEFLLKPGDNLVESAVIPLDAERADTVRRAVNTILQQAEPPKPNITKEEQDAINSLKEDNTIMILPADKGRASVVLDTDTYHAKMSALIETGPYQLLNKDPTDRLTRKLRSCSP